MKTITSKTILVAGFALALALTFSCSSDDDKGGGKTAACEETYHSIEMCKEYSGKYDKEIVKQDCEYFQGKYSDSCPSANALKCKYDDGLVTIYIYGNSFKNCAEACQQESLFCDYD